LFSIGSVLEIAQALIQRANGFRDPLHSTTLHIYR
jgi:hypothetical protein